MNRSEIPIPTPCGADWNDMTPAGRSRFCDACRKHVHDLSEMTSDEARTLLSSPATEGLCVRYLCDTSGAVVFRPEPAVRLVAPSRLARVKRYAAAAAALALPMSLNACMGTSVGPAQKLAPAAAAPSTSGSAPTAKPIAR